MGAGLFVLGGLFWLVFEGETVKVNEKQGMSISTHRTRAGQLLQSNHRLIFRMAKEA